MPRTKTGPKGASRKRKGAHSEHDRGYKLLFSHRFLVEALIRGFLPAEWSDHLDFTTLEKVGGSGITDDLRERHDDVIWRLCWKDSGGRRFWVYLILELQSKPDRYMAVRLLTYSGLLLQELIREGRLEPDGQLPAVISVVLYHGKAPWRGPLELGGCFTPLPPHLRDHLPQIRFRILDAGRLPLEHPKLRDNPVAALLRLETAEARQAVSLVRDLDRLIPEAEEELRRAFSIWLARLFQKFPFGVKISGGKINLRSAPMLEETFKEWEQKLRREARLEGQQEILRKETLGMQKLVLDMLRQRFGPVPPAVRQRVQDISSSTELRRLARRILTARSLEKTGLSDPE